MPLRDRVRLVGKELRDALGSRAFLLVAVVTGPLVAHGFATAISTYAEVSGVPGGPAALTQALSPLDGFVSPALGAYALVATLLFPFLAIRSVSADKESGAHLLALQGRFRLTTIVRSKVVATMLVWCLLLVPGLVALALWRALGGHLAFTETAWVLGGHVLRGAFVVALGIAAAALTDSSASAAVVALGVTLGGWALDFAATVQGGMVANIAQFTPDSALRGFEQGYIQLRVILVTLVVIIALLTIGIVWLEPARRNSRRLTMGVATLAGMILLATFATRLPQSWDASEDRRNSFSIADEHALATISAPVRVEAYLGPEDPRRADLERNVFRKLRRSVRDFDVIYSAQTRTGLFEGPGSHYGEVWYSVGDQRELNRSSVEPIVLETIYRLAGTAEPSRADGAYPGYPLREQAPRWQVLLLAAGWPLLVISSWLALRRRTA